MSKEFKIGDEVSVEFMGEIFEIHKYGNKVLYKVRVAEFDLNMAEVEGDKLFKLPTEEEIRKKKVDK